MTVQPATVTGGEIAAFLAGKIRNADRVLETLSDELLLLVRNPGSWQMNDAVRAIAKVAARRNALIEVWQFATNERWADD